MLDSLYISATGMHAEQAQIDAVANNLVNMNTMAFKKSHVAFETLMPREQPAISSMSTMKDAGPSYLGLGVNGTNTLTDFSAGPLKQTQNEFDFAIQGEGLFEVQLADGSFAYTRMGSMHIDSDGYIVNADGYPLSAMLQVPSDIEKVMIGADGRVQFKLQNTDRLTDAGYIELSHFSNAAALKPIGSNLYVSSEQSGEVIYSRAGENGVGTIAQGYLEGSNVQMIEELTTMMTAQRAYEANSRVLQASDEILGIINNLRK
jgi:flagellar basal-body rod protein FlgG